MKATPKDVARFASKVNFSGSGGCWIWLGAKNDGGYGQIWVNRKARYAHRVCYEFLTGSTIPSGLYLDHRCRNTLCVNPDHLRVVTNKQNQEHRAGAQSNSSTGIRGVSYRKQDGLWDARVGHHGERHSRTFRTREEAEAQVIAWRMEFFTHNDCEVLP